ncbi:MADF domain [Cinara cedri]|uniref:MADF domain n=1 Tax=Cinara cedri TaxID=506608 RepID=A0A5E4N879_9HEMI|nr:MADF domain [Cinara cedri]
MDEQLIEKVREHEFLYNHISHDYRDQHIQHTAWEEIVKELQISVNLNAVKLLLAVELTLYWVQTHCLQCYMLCKQHDASTILSINSGCTSKGPQKHLQLAAKIPKAFSTTRLARDNL